MTMMDTSHSWLVLSVVFLTNILTLGFTFGSLGVFVQYFNEYFSTGSSITGWIGAVGTAVLLAFCKYDTFRLFKIYLLIVHTLKYLN